MTQFDEPPPQQASPSSIQTGGGDFIARDKVIYGDEIRGDKIEGDSIVVGNMDHTFAAIGRGASVIINQALSAADQARAKEDYEHEKLALNVSRLIQTLNDQARISSPVTDAPYKYLLPFEFRDAWRFFGRDEFRKETLSTILGPELSHRLVVLHGDAGMGKTSLLRASIVPALVAAGYLPLLVRATGESLVNSVKNELLPNLAQLDYIQKAPLREFLDQVQTLLPREKDVYVLVDQFEEFFELSQDEQKLFTDQLADCLFTEPPIGHWLLCVQSAKVGYISTLAPDIPQPLANTLVLPPLTPAQAKEAILKPAELAGLKVEEGLLDVLLQDLGGNAIDPAKLQLVCHTMAQSAKSEPKTLSLQAYSTIGRAEAILRDHLTLVLQQNFSPADAEPAWQALSIIAEHPAEISGDELSAELATYAVGQKQSLRVLEMLELNRLIRLHKQAYQLTSPALLDPIHKWAEQRAALEQAQIEARRQLESVRESALRGLFGGSLGFMLAYLVTQFNQTQDWLVLIIVTLFIGLIGGVAGIAFIFLGDIARASFRGKRRAWQALWAGVTGAVIFAVAFFFQYLLRFQPDIFGFLLAIIEGALWGLAAGAGTAIVMLSKRPFWLTVSLSAGLSGMALWVGEIFGNVYQRPRIGAGEETLGILVFLAGGLMYLALVGATLWGRQQQPGDLEPGSQP